MLQLLLVQGEISGFNALSCDLLHVSIDLLNAEAFIGVVLCVIFLQFIV